MKKTLVISAIALSMTACQSTGSSSDSTSGSVDATSIASMVGSLTNNVQAQETSPIVQALTGQLGVTAEQATGGAGALLALASNSLTGSNSSELSNLIPGMSSLQESAPGLMSLASNMDAVNQVFGALGLDASMVSQFAPVILQYLTSQNASSGLLSSLGSLWGTQ
ncbi:DUF2780 domain-containing protein [Vibrio hannami]|nr:DUF2780 domain-containing protein [Vibrio hannami]MDG3087012.1 DUF2780 domain-containing protein [Vibrio hannami]